MTASKYKNLVTICGSDSDSLDDGTTVGGIIFANFQAIAGLISLHSTSTSSGAIVGLTPGTSTGTKSITAGGTTNSCSGSYAGIFGGYSNTSYGSYSSIVAGSNNTNGGNYSGIIGAYSSAVHGNSSAIAGGYRASLTGDYSLGAGYNLSSSLSGGIVTNYDLDSVSVEGFSFMKSMTISAGRSYESSSNTVCVIPSGGMALIVLHIIDPSAGTIDKVTLKIYSDSYGYITPEETFGNANVTFYFTSNYLYIYNSNSSPIQVGVFGTIVGEAGGYYDSDSGSDYYGS